MAVITCSVPMNRTEPNFRPCSSSVHQSWVQVRFSSSKPSSGSVRFTKAKVQFKFSSSLKFSVQVQFKFGSKFMNKFKFNHMMSRFYIYIYLKKVIRKYNNLKCHIELNFIWKLTDKLVLKNYTLNSSKYNFF